MEYVFLVVAAAWAIQFILSYYQLRRFHRQLAALRKLGRVSVGMYGNRWRGRTYGVIVADQHDLVRHAAALTGWTVFSNLQPVSGLNGMRVDAILTTVTPPAGLRKPLWLALQHAAQFLTKQPTNMPRATAPATNPNHEF